MSLLNTVLSSINGSQAAAASNPSISKPNSSVRKDNGAAAATRPQAISANIAPKRKAEDSGRDVKTKLVRVETNTSLAPPPSRSATSSPAQRQGAPLPKAQMPYRGTAGPSIIKSTTTVIASGPPSRPVVSAPTTVSAAPSAAPKSGYLAVLERAKAAQAAAKAIGQIKHKPVEKLTKKDRLRLQAEAAAAAKGKKPIAKVGSQGPKGRGKSVEPVDPKTGAPIKEKRKPVDVGYKGTMRAAPSAPSYSGTMRGPGAAPRKSAAPSSKEPSYRYADYSDEEEEEEEEENYDSESDMEAGLDEVDFEEEESARIARKEDAEALRLENQLKKEKAEKKRKLEQMAAAAGAKKKRY